MEFLVGVFKENGYNELVLRKWMRQVREKLNRTINTKTETNENIETNDTM